jgi:hypothetical protein
MAAAVPATHARRFEAILDGGEHGASLPAGRDEGTPAGLPPRDSGLTNGRRSYALPRTMAPGVFAPVAGVHLLNLIKTLLDFVEQVLWEGGYSIYEVFSLGGHSWHPITPG